MVNNQTSQYELLISIFHLSRLGIFQCVRAILQLSLPIDHPVLQHLLIFLSYPNTSGGRLNGLNQFAPESKGD